MASSDHPRAATAPRPADAPIGAVRAWAMIAILSALYYVSFVDRFVLGLLVAPIKAELGVSDVEIGLLFGTAFAVFYGLLGIPLARLADRRNRVALIPAGVVLGRSARSGRGSRRPSPCWWCCVSGLRSARRR